MREELKQREAELEKSSEDKQQLKSQVQNLKEGLQNLQNTHAMQVRDRKHTFCELSSQIEEGARIFPGCVLLESSFLSLKVNAV